MTFNILIPFVPTENTNDNDMYQWFNGLINGPVPDGLGYTDCTIIDIVAIYWSQISDTVFALCKLTTE